LTDMPLKIDEIIENDCGSCKACISACPAGAIKENPADFDLQACYQQLDYFRKKENLGQHICGLCVKACFGKKTKTMLK
ncbi:MAG: 4Fe-4S double cluster binding domain-containing protein, partial [Candidatus Poribacteria bacterium]